MFLDVLIPGGQEAQRGGCMFLDVLIPVRGFAYSEALSFCRKRVRPWPLYYFTPETETSSCICTGFDYFFDCAVP